MLFIDVGGLLGHRPQLAILKNILKDLGTEGFRLYHVHEHDEGRAIYLLDIKIGVCRQNNAEDAVKDCFHVGLEHCLVRPIFCLIRLFELSPMLTRLLYPHRRPNVVAQDRPIDEVDLDVLSLDFLGGLL